MRARKVWKFEPAAVAETVRSGRRQGWRAGLALICLGLVGAVCATSCSSDRAAARDALVRIYTPLPPPFLTGPAVLLLTNGGTWQAHVTFNTGAPMDAGAGELTAAGSKLRFTPEYPGKARKRERRGGFSFVWDVAEHRGFILSDALQGYAPISSGLQPTNVTFGAAGSTQRFEGHPCSSQDVTVQLADGSTAGFRALRATDLGGLTLQIRPTAGASTLTADLSRIRPSALSAEDLTRLEGFTRYSSAEAMTDELAAREHNLRRPSSPSLPPELYYQGAPRRGP